jgi:hypothetical protein
MDWPREQGTAMVRSQDRATLQLTQRPEISEGTPRSDSVPVSSEARRRSLANLRRGNPGNHGGRPREADLDFLRGIVESPEHQEAVRTALTDPANRNFARLATAAYDRIAGKAVQPVDAQVSKRLEIVVVDAMEERRRALKSQ